MEQDSTGVSSTPPEVPTFSAVDQAVIADDPRAYRAARAAERAGTPLEPTRAESASAEPAEQAASTDASSSPASEPGKGKGKGAEDRKRALQAEIEDLLRRRRELRSEVAASERPPTKPADSSPATAEPTKRDISRYKQLPGYPKADDYEDYDDLVTARAEFVAEQRLQEARERDRVEQHTGEFIKSRDAMLAKGREAFDDFDDVLQAAEVAGVEFPPHVVQTMLTHEHGYVLARELASKAATDRAFRASLADPVQFGMAIGQILAAHATPSPAPTFTKAPEPPPTLGRKSSDVLDPVDAAVRDGNEEAFLAAKRAQRAAAMR